MAKARNTPPADGSPEAENGDAARAEEQMAEQAAAEEKREKEEAKAMETKAAGDSEAPPVQKGQGEGAKYSVQRLIESGPDFLGQPSHVVAGALASSEKAYLTVDEAARAVNKWLGSEVATGGEEG